MNSSITKLVFFVPALLLPGRAMAQPSRDEVYNRLPYANKLILSQLDQIGISKDWGKARKRDSERTFRGVFANSRDARAWNILESHFVFRDDTSDGWRKYWQWISYQPTKFPTAQIVSGEPSYGELLALPHPPLPSGSAGFSQTYPKPLPGDVILFGAKRGVVCGVWWGNQRFPHWRNHKTPASFFYYTYEPYVKDKSGTIFTGISYNSYPPRITPRLYKALYPNTKAEELKPNGELFERGRGYLASGMDNAYAWFYMPTGLRDWANQSPGFVVLRRKAEYVLRITRFESKPQQLADGVDPNDLPNDKQGGTLSKYALIAPNNAVLASGYMLEPASPPSKVAGTDRATPVGEYRLINNPGSKGDFRLVVETKTQATILFGTRGSINIHIGNFPEDIKGCLAPGTGYSDSGSYLSVSNSASAYATLKTKILSVGTELKDMYDGQHEYANATVYKDLVVRISATPNVSDTSSDFLKELVEYSTSALFERLKADAPYMYKTRADIFSDQTVRGGCQVRAEVVGRAIREYAEAKGEVVSVYKVFAIGRDYPKPSIQPLRNGKPIEVIPFDGPNKQMTIEWAFHVAGAFEYKGRKYVLDLGLHKGLSTPSAWGRAQRDVASGQAPTVIESRADTRTPDSAGKVPPR